MRNLWSRLRSRWQTPQQREAHRWLHKLQAAPSADDRHAAFAELLAQMDGCAPDPSRDATGADGRQKRQITLHALLTALTHHPHLLSDPAARAYLREQIDDAELGQVRWGTPVDLVAFYTGLYGYPCDDRAVREDIRHTAARVLQAALRQSAREQEYERLVEVLRLVPRAPGREDSGLRHVAELYELRQVRNKRYLLYSYLMIQAVLVVVVFPLLFMNAENGEIQRRIEETAGVELGDDGYRLFSYSSALYWSIITATSIGYGDNAPLTNTGRIIAAILGTMGVVTIGVAAGLILRWITPRMEA